MAHQISGKDGENQCLEIKLNEALVAKRKLRFMYLYQPNIASTVLEKNGDCLPLFLGSDVLSECSISHNNLPRTHAKHAAKGLATKVNFPPFTKVLGIHGTARGVWFYSVQGLFKIAFEYYSRLEQDGCLRELEKMWRSCLLDPKLKNEIHVVLGKQVEHSCEQSSQQSSSAWTALLSDSQESLETSSVEPQITADNEDVKNSADEHEIVKEIANHVEKLSEICDRKMQQELRLLKIYLSFINKNNQECFVERTIIMVKNCLALLPEVSENCDLSEREIILSEIAGWVGTEFARYYDHVSERVTLFKQKHIRNIENLPCAEVLVNEVFPMSMQNLLSCWLNVSRDGQSPRNKSTGDPKTLFPVMQVILELVNRNLLSGVAHVLYSRLILSDSV